MNKVSIGTIFFNNSDSHTSPKILSSKYYYETLILMLKLTIQNLDIKLKPFLFSI